MQLKKKKFTYRPLFVIIISVLSSKNLFHKSLPSKRHSTCRSNGELPGRGKFFGNVSTATTTSVLAPSLGSKSLTAIADVAVAVTVVVAVAVTVVDNDDDDDDDIVVDDDDDDDDDDDEDDCNETGSNDEDGGGGGGNNSDDDSCDFDDNGGGVVVSAVNSVGDMVGDVEVFGSSSSNKWSIINLKRFGETKSNAISTPPVDESRFISKLRFAITTFLLPFYPFVFLFFSPLLCFPIIFDVNKL